MVLNDFLNISKFDLTNLSMALFYLIYNIPNHSPFSYLQQCYTLPFIDDPKITPTNLYYVSFTDNTCIVRLYHH